MPDHVVALGQGCVYRPGCAADGVPEPRDDTLPVSGAIDALGGIHVALGG